MMTSNPQILLPKMLKLQFFLVNEMLFDDRTVMRVYVNLSSKESKTVLETRFSFNSGIFIHCITKKMYLFPSLCVCSLRAGTLFDSVVCSQRISDSINIYLK